MPPTEPLAYPNVLLRSHLAAVSANTAYMLSRRLEKARLLAKPLDEAIGVDRSLLRLTVLAAALHDIGKAAHYYQVERKAESFPGHEFVGAILIYNLHRRYLLSSRDEAATALLFASWVIARHHAAMKGRHPADFAASRVSAAGDIEAASREVARALRSVPESLESFRAALPGPVASLIGSQLTVNRSIVSYASVHGVRSIVGSFAALPCSVKIPSVKWNALVNAAVGAIIVSDILTAKAEGRETDDRMSGYAKWWLRELGAEPRKYEDVKEAESVLEEVLEPLKGIF